MKAWAGKHWISQQYCQILRLSEPLAITGFLLKMHYSYSCCCLLNSGLRKHVPEKEKIIMWKELHEEKHNNSLLSGETI